MIVREYHKTREDGVKLFLTYSDAGVMIRQTETGAEYDAAIDVEDAPYTYTETDLPLDETAQKAAAFDYLTGRSGDNE